MLITSLLSATATAEDDRSAGSSVGTLQEWRENGVGVVLLYLCVITDG